MSTYAYLRNHVGDSMTFVFDLDNTLCLTKKNVEGFWEYKSATPILERIEKVNTLWQQGHHIIIETARGSTSQANWYEFTYSQLVDWGMKFHVLRTGVKFSADYFIDDRGVNSEVFFNG